VETRLINCALREKGEKNDDDAHGSSPRQVNLGGGGPYPSISLTSYRASVPRETRKVGG